MKNSIYKVTLAAIVLLALASGCKTKTNQATEAFQKAIEESGFTTYTNDRFGFSIDYPKCFEMAPPPENGDGQEFTWGDISLVAYGSLNVFNESAEDLAAQDSTSTFRKIDGNSYTSSGTDVDGMCYYRKEVLIDDTWYTSSLTYPQEFNEALKEVKEKAVDGFDGR